MYQHSHERGRRSTAATGDGRGPRGNRRGRPPTEGGGWRGPPRALC